jgi:hypothetical protein
MQKRKINGRLPRSLGSDRHRTDGGVDDDDDVDWEVAQPARAKASRTRSVIRRVMGDILAL